MICQEVEVELVGYHFGVLSGEVRDEVEAHLSGCARCVRELIAVKRAIETASEAKRPSAKARARLREAVAQELGVSRAWAWWERPLAIALAASIVLVSGQAMRLLTSLPGAAPHALTDHR